MKVSKDGGVTFVEIDDNPEQQKIAQSKGYEAYVEVTNGEKNARIKATPDQMKIAQDKGYNLLETHANKMKSMTPREPYSPLMSAAHGAANTASMGFGDEIYGGIQAAKAGLSGKPMGDAYTSNRDVYRKEYNKSSSDNPVSNFVGQVGGGMLMPGAAATKGASLGKAMMSGAKVGAAQGAIQGVGDSEEMDNALGSGLAGGVGGGLMGGAGGLVGRAIARPSRTAKDIKEVFTDQFPAYLRAAVKGTAEGAKAGQERAGGFGSLIGAPIGGVQAVVDQRRQLNNLERMVQESRASGESVLPGTYSERPPLQIAGPRDTPRSGQDFIDAEYVDGPAQRMLSAPKPEGAKASFAEFVSKPKPNRPPEVSPNLTNKEYVARMMLEPGPSKMKKFYSEKAASQFPGQLDSETANRIHEMGTDARTRARTFNRDDAANDLVKPFEQSRQVFKEARSQRFGELQEQASKQYQGSDKILQDIGDALEDSLSTNETKGIQGLLQDIQNKVAAGKGTRRQGLKPGNWDEVDGVEKFNRLQKAREQLYAKKIFAKKEGLSEAEYILQDLVNKIDDELKLSPEKVEADAMYTKAKRLDKSMFNKADFEGGVDKYKIANMLKNTESAKRFRDNLSRFQEFIDDPNLNPKLKKEGQQLLDQFKSAADLSEQQRVLNDFRYRNGPSSGAIERQTAVLGGKTSPLTQAVTAPSGFFNSADQMAKDQSKRLFGKPFSQLSPEEKDKVVKVWFWQGKNPDHDEDDLMKFFKKLK